MIWERKISIKAKGYKMVCIWMKSLFSSLSLCSCPFFLLLSNICIGNIQKNFFLTTQYHVKYLFESLPMKLLWIAISALLSNNWLLNRCVCVCGGVILNFVTHLYIFNLSALRVKTKMTHWSKTFVHSWPAVKSFTI